MNDKGLTFLELLVVVGLIAIISGSVLLAYGQARRRETVTGAVIQIVQILTSGRANSVSGKADAGWKVRLLADRVILMRDSGEVAEEYRLPDKVELTAGVEEIVFNRTDGRAVNCEAGCVFTVRTNSGSVSQQFRVLFSGGVDY